ncbi:hypothetical protein BPC006_II0741 [Burkholderia pseudomallei BPC006]|nr:hypothetical protein BPC006_II0741 [Burkholderia pseudomallei BPC006]
MRGGARRSAGNAPHRAAACCGVLRRARGAGM